MDIVQDIKLLNETLHIRKICLIVFRISGILLKIGIANDLTPREIAKFYIRSDTPSLLEKIVQQCVAQMYEYTPYDKREYDHEGWNMHMENKEGRFISTL